ncbi:MAG: leucine-rich repeat domain-containing protein [Clostridia bacterium]|nr:leucine-rich repeat domain-containing protein [Clostridia bacterium]
MKKRKISISLGRITLITIILTAVYFAFINLGPIFIYIIQNQTVLNGSKTETASTSNNSYEQQIISYEDREKLRQKFPNLEYHGKVYYTVYGKRVLEDDTFLDLSDIEVDENLVDKLMLLKNINEVSLYNQNFSMDEKMALHEIFPNVKFNWIVEILGENVDSNTETLDLSNKTIADINGFKQTLRMFTNLKTLDMSNTNLSNEELGSLREAFPNVRIDWVVHLGKWSLRTDAVAFSVLVTQFDYRRMTSADIQVLKYCTELQALDLGHQAIEDISVIGEYLPNLRVLILADNKIKDISPLANLVHLHYLELFMNDITDVTPLASCTELVDLNICFNYRFSNVDGILNLPKLERLWLISDRISSESYRLIRQTYPNVTLVTTGTGSTGSGWRSHERYFTMIDMYRNNYISDVFLKYGGINLK